jgi:hypothetical protein
MQACFGNKGAAFGDPGFLSLHGLFVKTWRIEVLEEIDLMVKVEWADINFRFKPIAMHCSFSGVMTTIHCPRVIAPPLRYDSHECRCLSTISALAESKRSL